MMAPETFLAKSQKLLPGIKINVSLTAGEGEVGWRAVVRVANGGACDVVAGGETPSKALAMLESDKLEILKSVKEMRNLRVKRLRSELAKWETKNQPA